LIKYRSKLEGDAKGFLNQWKSGSFEASGQSLGDIPHILFDLCEPAPMIPIEGIPLFIDGFLRGALDKEIGRVDECLKDGDKLIVDIENLINDVSHGFDLIQLIGDIGKLLTDVPHSVRDCDEVKDTVEEVSKMWLNEIKNPITIAKIVYMALSQYKDRLVSDADTFVYDWSIEEFELSGQKLGDIPHVLFDMCASSDIEGAVKLLLNKE